MGRIRFGAKNVHYAVATEDSSGALTYGKPIPVLGVKSISLSAQGSTLDEYADNTLWYHEVSNNGYSGDIVFEDTASADTFLQTVLGQTVGGTSGAIIESASDKPLEFALAFQFELAGASETGKRVWLLRCSASRPQLNGETKTDSITVATNTVTITALPRINDDKVKASADSSASGYASWFSAVVEA